MQRDDSGLRRRDARKQVTVQAEFHFEEMTFPIRGQISELSAGGCFVETMFTKPADRNWTWCCGSGRARLACLVSSPPAPRWSGTESNSAR
jgi:hypothetical protein